MDWTTWGTTTVNLSLNQGVNTITFATVNTADGPNDKIILTPDPAHIRQSPEYFSSSLLIQKICAWVFILSMEKKFYPHLRSVKFRFRHFLRGFIS